MAAATVPEYVTSSARLGPWLMPETISVRPAVLHQVVDRDVRAVGGRAVHRVPALAHLADAQRAMDGDRVRGRALLGLRGDHPDLAQRRDRVRQRLQPLPTRSRRRSKRGCAPPCAAIVGPGPGPRSGRRGARGRWTGARGPAAPWSPGPSLDLAVLDEALDAAERGGADEEPRAAHRAERRLAPAAHAEREHAAEGRHLPRARRRDRGATRAPDSAPRATAGWRSRARATASAVALCAAMRQARVRIPRSTSQELNGEATGPRTWRAWSTRLVELAARGRRPAPRPARRCGRRGTWSWSAGRRRRPMASGRCSAGVAKVLSTIVCAPRSRAMAIAPARSTTLSSGFDGVSSTTRRVSGRSARAQPREVAHVHLGRTRCPRGRGTRGRPRAGRSSRRGGGRRASPGAASAAG